MAGGTDTITKSVPLTVLVGLCIQAGAIVWSMSAMSSDIQTNANEIARLMNRTNSLEAAVNTQNISLARIDENIKAIRTSVEKMADKKK
jgi:uncharacterized protein YoxC